MENNEIIATTSTSTEPMATGWPVPETATNAVKEFLSKYYPGGLVYLHNGFLAYSSGYWVDQDEQADILRSITEFFGSGAATKYVRELFAMLKTTCVVKGSDFKPNHNFVCFKNGALDMTTYQLVQHDPRMHLRSGRNVDWDPDAQAPVFEKFLSDVFRDDDDRDQKIQFMREWMGLCLIPDTSFEKFVVCVGDGGNGKSVLLKLMAELVGHENVYSAPIQRLCNRRALAELDGKLLLMSSEINENTVMDDGVLKQIVSGDMVEAERKYERPFAFIPTTRIMLATNHLPKLRDVTHAFFRRLVMIRFNRNFTADEMDMNLPAKLSAELDGIFAVAVRGLKSLRDRKYFVVPASSKAASDQYREDSDQIKMFADEALVRCTEKGMQPAALYKLYTTWASAFGVKAENNIVLGKRLKQMGFAKTRSNG
ncbi:phage/plasmid primase, P4 family [Dechloromonas sp. XY25]|uniref:Phage/plasmid primase, P4 family n=1 Tax=Dechloromonas hankyongensis TaxID=2908002 RepID=A0ABS9K4H1_9RHOO|nr:phage/plasmid primase, P4 family [Dechloromonas hankyongensis]MCG2578074.1 phage/plasmid primase, P4 family [Dechloromonas hankyongensis]